MSNYNSTLQSNNTDLQAILNTINELPSGRGSLKSGILTGVTTYGIDGEYYYYDLSEFNDKTLICLYQVSSIGTPAPDRCTSIIAKQNTSSSFECIISNEVITPLVLEENILKSVSSSYYYYAA